MMRRSGAACQTRTRCVQLYGAALVVVGVWIVGAAASQQQSSSSNYYQHYNSYPEYCSTPAQMSNRTIPPLRTNVPVGETRIVHVTVITRHGARVPTGSSPMDCWDGYWDSTEYGTNHWNCDYKTATATPSPQDVLRAMGLSDDQVAAASPHHIIYDKVYDALSHNDSNIDNILHGTCQVGQLLPVGLDQMKTIGGMLRDAYLYDGTVDVPQHDLRLQLMPQVLRPHKLHVRSDDEQRTLASAVAVLQGLFPSQEAALQQNLVIHTADLDRDVVTANGDECNMIYDLEANALLSREFAAYNATTLAPTMVFMQDNFGDRELFTPRACLMEAICNDRGLPDILDDYDNDDSHFRLLELFDNRLKQFPWQYNDSAAAKLSMAPLWVEIMQHFAASLDITNDDMDGADDMERLTLVSAHDTTVAQLLTTLGPDVWSLNDWPTYAATVVLELHEVVGGHKNMHLFPSSHVFRLLYNGQVLTPRVAGCSPDADVCDLKVLLDQLDSFATLRDRVGTCSAFSLDDLLVELGFAAVKDKTVMLIQTRMGAFLLATVVLLCAFCGGVFTWWRLTRQSPFSSASSSYANGGATVLSLESLTTSSASRTRRRQFSPIDVVSDEAMDGSSGDGTWG